MSRPESAAADCSKSHGLPKLPRPIIAMSAPVNLRMRTAASGEKTSPLAMTGMLTACLTSRIVFQSASPPYICMRVRPCTATALTPTSSSILASSTALMLPLSQPHGAAHVDIQDVRAGNFDRHLRGLGHAVHIAAKDLRGKRLFARKRTKQLRGLRVVVAQRLGAHKLRDGVARAFFGADLAECSIRYARHRRERELRFNFYRSDLHSPPLFDNNTSIV